MKIHFKGRWPDAVVPEGEPLWLFYEVCESTDVVTRMVEVFPSGASLRDSMLLAEREGFDARHPDQRSLVHGDFLHDAAQWLDVISEAEFDRAWQSATDKPRP